MEGLTVSQYSDDFESDTVTPLDVPEEGFGELPDGPDSEPEADVTPDSDVDEDEGKVTVRTRRGYAFQSSDKDLPVVDFTGVKVTQEQADFLVDESDGIVSVVKED